MTTKQIIELRIKDLETKIRVHEENSKEVLKQIQQGVENMEVCKGLVSEYDFDMEQIKKAEHDLNLMQLAIKAIEEERK